MSSILTFFLSWLILNTGFPGKASFGPDIIRITQDSTLAKINLSEESGKIKIQGLYLGKNFEPLAYKLTIQKKGKGGTSNNTQSGKFKNKPGQKEFILATSSFNTQPNDEFLITLDIYQDSSLISQEILKYTAP